MAISGEDIGAYAQQFLGTPYVWGGNSLTKGVDCSGLVQQVFKHFGINLPRVTYDQIGQGSPVGMKGLRPGDLVFFDTASGITLSIEICIWSRPAAFSRLIRSGISR